MTIDRNTAYRYMGFRAPFDVNVDAATAAVADECERLLLEAAQPRSVSRVFDIERGGDELRLGDVALRGESIRRHLEGCDRALILCSTLSQAADRFISVMSLRSTVYGIATDALASAYIEQVNDAARQAALSELGCEGNFCFAAGYGDFPLDAAGELLTALDAYRGIGVALTASGMLTPTKSIIGVVGAKRGT